MSTAMLQGEHPVRTPTGEARVGARRDRSVFPALTMVSGVLVLAIAASLALGGHGTAQPTTAQPATVPETTAGPPAITLAARDISVVSQVYGPGESSGWHAHSGIHAVAVLSGELTVYDGNCRAERFRPGRPYVGGQEIHLVRNETAAPVEMAVTYLSPSAGGGPTRRMAAPEGCGA